MIVNISSDAEADIADGFWFYEGQNTGLGDYFRSSIIADIESLSIFGGIHQQARLSPITLATVSLHDLLPSRSRRGFGRRSA